MLPTIQGIKGFPQLADRGERTDSASVDISHCGIDIRGKVRIVLKSLVLVFEQLLDRVDDRRQIEVLGGRESGSKRAENTVDLGRNERGCLRLEHRTKGRQLENMRLRRARNVAEEPQQVESPCSACLLPPRLWTGFNGVRKAVTQRGHLQPERSDRSREIAKNRRKPAPVVGPDQTIRTREQYLCSRYSRRRYQAGHESRLSDRRETGELGFELDVIGMPSFDRQQVRVGEVYFVAPLSCRPIEAYSPRAARSRWFCERGRSSAAARKAAVIAAFLMLAPVRSEKRAASAG